VDLRADPDGCGKSRPPLGFDPRTVQLLASRYTDCAIPAHNNNNNDDDEDDDDEDNDDIIIIMYTFALLNMQSLRH